MFQIQIEEIQTTHDLSIALRDIKIRVGRVMDDLSLKTLRYPGDPVNDPHRVWKRMESELETQLDRILKGEILLT